ncbi:serine/arginine repetitive matrix protein 1-like isoform X3 [Daphnia pulex]|uniref:serine/arginine repetitive matrix protein 1-like isoform X3 n=1 Tax=Daphnia pulex TaxID=6669 RepID=UPI001EDFF610|nr:serine/arginine repetitive matrix protein 1-like isoform X3 [Daphnia pulex]
MRLVNKIHNNNNAGHSGGGSDPSLLSINSCELDEAPFVSLRNQQPQAQPQPQQQSGKVLQKAGGSNNNNNTATESDGRLDAADDGLLGMAAPLNHSAARHKIAIRPKRNHAPARPRQLPQLAEGPVEDDLAWTSHPSGEIDQQVQHVQPSVPERKNRIGRLLRSEPVSAGAFTKLRSVSLSRTEDSAIKEAPIYPVPSSADPSSSSSHPASTKPSAGSSSVKLARSKSSVEKKIQHEVAVFWRRTKEGKLFQKKETPDKEGPANADQGGSKGQQQQPQLLEVPEAKRKDLRKIKRDKEEKRKRSDASANKEESSPPFLSRIFGSRRSSRRLRKKTPPPAAPPSPPPKSRTPSPAVATEPVPVPRSAFRHEEEDDDEEMEIDWRIPHQPTYTYAPPPSRSAPPQTSRLVEKWAETDFHAVRAPMASPKASRMEECLKMSPTPTRHHRIHIAGLSPYQRRVARIGNGLEISDDEWDKEPAISPTRSYHFRPEDKDPERRSGLSLNLENSMKSLPVNINQEFTLKKASPTGCQVPPPLSPIAGENLRRSFEILKYSNEGLKKTIHSFNPKRMSQSSDQLHLSDGSAGQRESSGSLSNSTSSLNISDADDTAETNGSLISLSAQSTGEKDVRDDILIVDDHKETIHHQVVDWTESKPAEQEDQLGPELLCNEESIVVANTLVDSSSSHPDIIPESGQNVQPSRKTSVTHHNNITAGSNVYETEIRSKPPSSPEEPIRPATKHKSWESRQLVAPIEPPAMFSMSVRVQNPPDVKFKRSISNPSNETTPLTIAPEAPAMRKLSDTFQHQPSRPFIMSVRMGGADGEGTPASLPPQQLMAKLSARPWQSKEEKDRQNKVALVRSQHAEPDPPPSVKPEEVEIPPAEPVKLRPKTQAKEETSELLKVFARRSVKVRDSKDLTDAMANTTEANAEARNEMLSAGGSIPVSSRTSPSAAADCVTKEDITTGPAEVIAQSVEKMDLSKEKIPPKKVPKPPVAIRTTMGQPPPSIDPPPPADRFLKSSGKVPPFFRPGAHESTLPNDNPVPSVRPFVPLIIRLPADDKSASDPSDKSSKSSSPTSPSQADPSVFEESSSVSDTNRIIESTSVTTDAEVVWKKHQTKPRPSDRFLSAHKFAAKTIDEEVKAATAIPPTRQSKVLDMVNNFQRLQVT